MFKILIATTSIILFSLSAQAQKFSSVYNKYKNSIPLILNQKSICSGALIEKNLILTAAHCVNIDRGRPVYVAWPDDPKTYIKIKTEYISTQHDLALIKLPYASKRTLFPIFDTKGKIQEGDPVATIGHPTLGIMSATRHFDMDYVYLLSVGVISKINEKTIITDTSISPGNSGGPLFTINGEIVGMVSRKRVGSAIGSIGVAPNHKVIHNFITDYKSGKQNLATSFFKKGYNFFDFNFLYVYHSLGIRHSILDKETLNLALSFDYHRKYFLRFETAFRSDYSFYKSSFGYNYYMEFSEFNVLKLQASLDHIYYSIEASSDPITLVDQLGYSLGFEFSRFPIGLRYTGFSTNGNNEYNLTVNLSGEF